MLPINTRSGLLSFRKVVWEQLLTATVTYILMLHQLHICDIAQIGHVHNNLHVP